MEDFEELYGVFIKTIPARAAVQEFKNQHSSLNAREVATGAKKLAEIAFNLDFASYFNPEIKEGAISRNWNNQLRSLNQLEPQQLEALVAYSATYAKKVMPNAKNPSEEALLRAVFALSAKAMAIYAPDRMNDKQLHRLLATVCEKITNPDNGLSVKEKYPLAMQTFTSLYQGNSPAYFNRLGMISKAMQKLDKPQKIGKVCEEIDLSYQNEGNITSATAKGFEQYVLPMINLIPDYENMSAEHDCSFGEYGLIGYTNKVLTSKWTPKELNEALGILKEVPTPDMLKREKLRAQAIRLEAADFNGLRDLIHSETIGVSELVGQMLAYYQATSSGDKTSAADSASKIGKSLQNVQSEEFLESYLDLDRYRKVIDETTGETTVDILQNIAANMQKSNSLAPLVKDAELDNLSQQFSMEGYTDVAKFGTFLGVLNNKIIENIETGKVGISPQMVDLLYWCDQKSATILKERDFEQQCGDHKSDWFKQVALFAELTNSAETKFNRKGFEAYYDHVQQQDRFFTANNILIKRQRTNIFKLFDASKASQKMVESNLKQRLEQNQRNPDEIAYETEKLGEIFDQRRRRIVSGNLICEILKLNDLKKPSTRIGQRYAEEMKRKCQIEYPAEKSLLKMLQVKKGKGK